MIHINRNNYESFFLLYIDNELSGVEKEAVESFLVQNADLKIEFDNLKQSIFQPDMVNFNNKEALLKKEPSTSVQDLLLLLDNELTPLEKKNTEKWINTDFSVAKEWEILQQTKLFADHTIRFENKALLYRRENARIVKMYWKRIAVAAILLGFGFWMGLQYYSNYQSNNNVGIVNGNIKEKGKSVIPAKSDSFTIAASNNTLNKNEGPLLQGNKTIAQREQKIISGRQKSIDNFQKIHLENINKEESNKNIVANVLLETTNLKLANNNAPVMDKELNVSNKNIVVVEDNNSYVAYNEMSEELNENKILYIDEEKVKRTKLGGLFRKVKRVFERTADIKTGGTLKIAGFEIAVR